MANKTFDTLPLRKTDFQRQTERMGSYNRAELESRINSGKAPAGCYDFLQLESIGIDAKRRVNAGAAELAPKGFVTRFHAALFGMALFTVGVVIGFLARGGPV